jgi:hypothetical protein
VKRIFDRVMINQQATGSIQGEQVW